MSDALQQAIVAIKTGNLALGRGLLEEILRTDPQNDIAWVWMSQTFRSDERRRACLDRAIAINPDNQEAQQAVLDWLTADEDTSIPTPARDEDRPTTRQPAKPTTSAAPVPPTGEIRPVPGTSLQDFLSQLQDNLNILKEREAKYGSTAAPLDLLNQIDDYEHAIALTQEAIDRAAPLEELQSEFNSLNLQISTVVFVAQEPPRKPFMGQNPYRGLRNFTEEDARFFFGRNAAIDSLLGTAQYLLETKTSQQVPDLMAVLGPSGSGKSSLVRAGFIPAIRAGRLPDSHQWPVKVMLPGPHPLDSLAEVFMGEGGWDLATVRKILNEGQKALHNLIVETLATAAKPDDAFFVLVIDQFEELFTLCEDEAERRAFIEQLLYATHLSRGRTLVVLTMRSDFYSKVAAYKPLAEAVTQHQMLVSPMTEKELREAILLPAEAVGLELEKALVETLLKDTFEAPGVLPLLQHALLELFHRRDGNLLTLAAYNEIGGVKGALAHRADGVINDLSSVQQQIARRIFMRLVRPGEGAADTRRRATFDEVISQTSDTQEVETVVKTLADANLIITSRNPETDQVVLDVSHEALIREWPLLRHWLNENRVGLRIQQQLSQATRDWDSRGRDEDSLYRGARLLEVEEWVADNPGEINPLEQAFIDASVEARERAASEKEAQRQRELEAARKLAEEAEARREAEAQQAREAEARAKEQAQAATSLRKRAVWLALAGVVAVILAIFAGIFGVTSTRNANLAATNANVAATREAEAKANANLAATRAAEANTAQAEAERQAQVAATREAEARQAQAEAEQQARRALAGQLAAQAQTGLEHQYDLALLASLASYDLLQSSQISDTVEAESSILAALTRFPQLTTFLQGHGAPVRAIALSPDGQTLVSGNDYGEIWLWDLTSEQPIGQLEGHEGVVRSVVFSPDGRIIASSSGDQTIILWDATNGEPLGEPLIGHKDWVNALAFSPDGRTLASGSDDNQVILWDVATGQSLGEPLREHTDWVLDVAFSPDGQTLASSSDDQTIILWDVQDRTPRGQLTGHEGSVNSIAFSPDGQTLASASNDNKIILWDVATGQPLGEPLEEHTDFVLEVTFSPDGQTLASGSADGTFILWDVSDLNSEEPLPWPMAYFSGHGSDVTEVLFAPDGQTLVSSSDDGSIIKWNVEGNLPIGRLITDQLTDIQSLAFSPDGQTLASGSCSDYDPGGSCNAGEIILWDVTTGEELKQLLGHEASVRSIAFSPDGQTLASGSSDTTVILWDVASGKQVGAPLTGHEDEVRSVAFSHDGQMLASGGGDGVILWDTASGQPLRGPLAGSEASSALSVAFSPDDQTLASGGYDQAVVLWDTASGQPLGEPLFGPTDSVNVVAFSPDGQLLASGSEDSTIRLWDTATQQPLSGNLTENNSVYELAFSPDGRILVTGGFDQAVVLWNVATRQRIGDPLTGHGGAVDGLAVSPDGKTIASGSWNGTIILWDLDLASWRAAACRRANRNLTQTEWDQLIGPDIPYQPVCPDLPFGDEAADSSNEEDTEALAMAVVPTSTPVAPTATPTPRPAASAAMPLSMALSLERRTTPPDGWRSASVGPPDWMKRLRSNPVWATPLQPT
jgi:WD40 repeat protein